MKDLSHIDISRLTEKNNGEDYLPWEECLAILINEFGYGNVKYSAIPSPQSGYLLSYSPDGRWASVHVRLSFRVNSEGKDGMPTTNGWHDFEIVHAVMAGMSAIDSPTSFDGNTAMQRGFVKLAAMVTGLGFDLWNSPKKEEMVRMFSMAAIKLNGPEAVFAILGCTKKEFEKFTPNLANVHLEKLREIVG